MNDALRSIDDPPHAQRGGSARDAALLIGAMLVAGTLAAIVRQDANWDLKNYHFYNAWAFVHERMSIDVAPAQLQTYLNPLLDLPFYAMVAAGWPPRAIAFAMGLFAGAGAFFLVKALLILFGDLPPRERRNYVVFAAALGLLAANPVALLASTMNEWQGAALTMLALWLILRRVALPAIGLGTLALAGFVSGAASGLKLTAAPFAVGLCAALLARRPVLQRGLPDAFAFGLAVLAGIAVTAGFWFHTLHDHFGSPVFPYYNAWIRSPWWDARPVLDSRFGPQSAFEWLYFPLLLLRRTAGLVATSGFRDWRLPVLYVAAVAAFVAWIIRRGDRSHPAAPGPVSTWSFVTVFWVTSYVVWLAVYAIYRYIIPLELLSGALLLFCLRRIFTARALNPAIVVLTVLLIAFTRYPYVERVDFGEKYIRVDVPPVAPGAAILLVADEPMSHVLPFFPGDARFVGVKNNLIDPAMTNRLAAEVARIVREHDGPFYALASTPGVNEGALAAHRLRRIADSCAPVVSNLTRRPLELCRLERIDAARTPMTANSSTTRGVFVRTPSRRGDGWTSPSSLRAWPCRPPSRSRWVRTRTGTCRTTTSTAPGRCSKAVLSAGTLPRHSCRRTSIRCSTSRSTRWSPTIGTHASSLPYSLCRPVSLHGCSPNSRGRCSAASTRRRGWSR